MCAFIGHFDLSKTDGILEKNHHHSPANAYASTAPMGAVFCFRLSQHSPVSLDEVSGCPRRIPISPCPARRNPRSASIWTAPWSNRIRSSTHCWGYCGHVRRFCWRCLAACCAARQPSRHSSRSLSRWMLRICPTTASYCSSFSSNAGRGVPSISLPARISRLPAA